MTSYTWYSPNQQPPEEPIRIIMSGMELDGWWWEFDFYWYTVGLGTQYAIRCEPGTVEKWRRRTPDDLTLDIAHPRKPPPDR